MVTPPKWAPHGSCLVWMMRKADPEARVGEGRCRVGRNGQVHHVSRRGTGPGNQGKIRRDNVGKVHLPAGTDNNLQRPDPIGAQPEVGGRVLDWRMSPYERGRRGNAL
jgi:hypothetical protein